MRCFGGLILLTGIGVALFVYLPTPVDSGASLARLQRTVASRFAQLAVRPTKGWHSGIPRGLPGRSEMHLQQYAAAGLRIRFA